NGAIKWVTKSALDPLCEKERSIRFDVLGIREGWRGLVEVNPDDPESLARHTLKLDEEIVRTWDRYGGTNLGTSRTNPFHPQKDVSGRVIENIGKLGIDAIVAIGGEDTLGVASKLYRRGIKTVGIPKTIDGDLVGTDYSLGFDSAVNVITEEIDRLRTTAGSHNRIFVVETMGRHAGWLALHGGECSGAYIILIPEVPFDMERVCSLLDARRGREVQYSILVVSEGATTQDKKEFCQNDKVDEFGHRSLGGIAAYIAQHIEDKTGFSARYVILSHLQRGGSPSARDRLMARWFGIAAVDMIVNEDFGRMVSYRQGEITSVPMKEVIDHLNLIDVEKYYDRKRYNGKSSIL
ncbi:MAG: ATP-dependent 6-phosphofructokinase, partial [Smithellaceae bacterium]|nr:ATP-dependent 6-phosphofructokinase [Smithellaceae bacterium]